MAQIHIDVDENIKKDCEKLKQKRGITLKMIFLEGLTLAIKSTTSTRFDELLRQCLYGDLKTKLMIEDEVVRADDLLKGFRLSCLKEGTEDEATRLIVRATKIFAQNGLDLNQINLRKFLMYSQVEDKQNDGL